MLNHCSVFKCSDPDFLQFNTFTTETGTYGLSNDVDVALWLDYTAYHKAPLLPVVNDFVIVESQLHDQFDLFKKAAVKSSRSLIPMNELLNFYCAITVSLTSHMFQHGLMR